MKSAKRSYPFAGKITPIGGNAQRRPKVLPSCGNRAMRATLHKTTQRGLPAYKYTYPVVVESSRGTRLVQAGQPGAVRRDCWSRLRIPAGGACLDAVVACGQRKLTMRIEIQRHPPQLAGTVVESPTSGPTEKQGEQIRICMERSGTVPQQDLTSVYISTPDS